VWATTLDDVDSVPGLRQGNKRLVRARYPNADPEVIFIFCSVCFFKADSRKVDLTAYIALGLCRQPISCCRYCRRVCLRSAEGRGRGDECEGSGQQSQCELHTTLVCKLNHNHTYVTSPELLARVSLNLQVDGFMPPRVFRANWTKQPGHYAPETQIDLPTTVINRNTTKTMFQVFTAGIGGTCDRFQPPAGYWCSNAVQGGGSTIYAVPTAMQVSKATLPNLPYVHTRTT
jgi:hypothetical protein